MKCDRCTDGVVGIVYAAEQLSEPLYCLYCNGEGVVSALPRAMAYEEVSDEEGNGNHGTKCEVHAEAIK